MTVKDKPVKLTCTEYAILKLLMINPNQASGLTFVMVEKLFDRFYTVEAARGSTGLGLAIARTLAEQMDGKISAKYQDGRLNICLRF